MSADQKRSALARAAKILGAEIHGLDTHTADDFVRCARELTRRCDVLVAAGGDGTLSDVINAIDTAQTPIAYLPLGTGNAVRHAFNYKGGLGDIATRIREGKILEYDLIQCDEKRFAFTASVGFEGTVIQLRDSYLAEGITGLRAYLKALFEAYFRVYKRTAANITVDGETLEVKNLLSLIVVKQPYYGYGMKVVPRARFDDQQLHVLSVNSGLFVSLVGAAAAFTIGNRIGQYLSGRHVSVTLRQPLSVQIDGNPGWVSETFAFNVLPKKLKIKC